MAPNKERVSGLDKFLEGTVGMFAVLFFSLIFMPTMMVFIQALDSLEQLWFVIKNPSSIIPDKVTFMDDNYEDDYCCG